MVPPGSTNAIGDAGIVGVGGDMMVGGGAAAAAASVPAVQALQTQPPPQSHQHQRQYQHQEPIAPSAPQHRQQDDFTMANGSSSSIGNSSNNSSTTTSSTVNSVSDSSRSGGALDSSPSQSVTGFPPSVASAPPNELPSSGSSSSGLDGFPHAGQGAGGGVGGGFGVGVEDNSAGQTKKRRVSSEAVSERLASRDGLLSFLLYATRLRRLKFATWIPDVFELPRRYVLDDTSPYPSRYTDGIWFSFDLLSSVLL